MRAVVLRVKWIYYIVVRGGESDADADDDGLMNDVPPALASQSAGACQFGADVIVNLWQEDDKKVKVTRGG